MDSKTEFQEFLERRRNKELTLQEVKKRVKECGYRPEWFDTRIPSDSDHWENARDAIEEIALDAKNLKIPYHFAYIKFYEKDGTQYALVAGKTNLEDPDFHFISKNEEIEGEREEIAQMGKNKAKVWLKKHGYKWHCQHVLIVWQEGQSLEPLEKEGEDKGHSPEARWAKTVESDIGGLLGLFFS